MAIALGESRGAVKVPHRSQFNAETVKRQLGVAVSSWAGFVARMKALSERKVSKDQAEAFFKRVLTYTTLDAASHPVTAANDRAVKTVQELFNGRGKGSNLPSAAGTAWGLLNGVTEFVDTHRRARSDDHRLDAAWFGAGAAVKQRAWDEAMKLVA